jgi:hypothetical protein
LLSQRGCIDDPDWDVGAGTLSPVIASEAGQTSQLVIVRDTRFRALHQSLEKINHTLARLYTIVAPWKSPSYY